MPATKVPFSRKPKHFQGALNAWSGVALFSGQSCGCALAAEVAGGASIETFLTCLCNMDSVVQDVDKGDTVRPGARWVLPTDLEHPFWPPGSGFPTCTAET